MLHSSIFFFFFLHIVIFFFFFKLVDQRNFLRILFKSLIDIFSNKTFLLWHKKNNSTYDFRKNYWMFLEMKAWNSCLKLQYPLSKKTYKLFAAVEISHTFFFSLKFTFQIWISSLNHHSKILNMHILHTANHDKLLYSWYFKNIFI